MADIVFSLPAVLGAIAVAFALALWPKKAWGPADYAFAVTAVVFCLAALGAGSMITHGDLSLLITVPFYLALSLLAVGLTYGTVRTIAEAREGVVTKGLGIVTQLVAQGSSGATLFARPGVVVFLFGFLVVWTEQLGGRLPLLALGGTAAAALFALQMRRGGPGTRRSLPAFLGLVGVSASLCAGPATLQGFEIRSALDDLPAYGGAVIKDTDIRPLAREAERRWEVEGSLPDVARFYDRALGELGWEGHWFLRGLTSGIEGDFGRRDPPENLTVVIKGGRSVGDLRRGAGLDEILATFASDAVLVTVELELDRRPEFPLVTE